MGTKRKPSNRRDRSISRRGFSTTHLHQRRLHVELLESRLLLAGQSIWTETNGGDWSDANNWNGGVPGSEDTAIFLADDSGTVRLHGADVTVLGFLVGDTDGEGQLTLDLDGGRLTTDFFQIAIEINESKSWGIVTVRDGTVSVESESPSVVGYTSAFRSSYNNPNSYGYLLVESGGRLDVSGELRLGNLSGSDYNYYFPYEIWPKMWSDGFVSVGSNGLVTTDQVNIFGVEYSGVSIHGENAIWVNDGKFSLQDYASPVVDVDRLTYLNVSGGGELRTGSLTGGPIYVNGGAIFTNNLHSNEVHLLNSGSIIVDGGTLSGDFDNWIKPGGVLTLQNGASNTNLYDTLWVGLEDSTREATFNVTSASSVERISVIVGRNGHLSVSGSDVDSSSFIAVDGDDARLDVTAGGRVEATDQLFLIGGGTLTLSDSTSTFDVGSNVTIGGETFYNATSTGGSRLSITNGATLKAVGDITVVEKGSISLQSNAVLDTANLIVDGGQVSGGGQINAPVAVQNGGIFAPGASSGVLNTQSITLADDTFFQTQFGGLIAGTQYSQLAVQGSVNLNNADLVVSETFTSDPGDTFIIIDNDGVEPIVGTFGGLLEGAVVVLEGVTYSITYQGGDGNDVVLTSNGNLPVVLIPTTQTSLNTPEISWFGVDGAASYSLAVNNLDTGQPNVVNVSGITDKFYQVQTPLALGQYEAFVQAFDDQGNPSLMSPQAVFTVVPPLMVDITSDTTDVNAGDGQVADSGGNASLRAAVMEANAIVGFDKIEIPAGTYTLTLSGSGEEGSLTGDLDITDDLVIVGAGAGLTFIDGNALDRVFDVHPGVRLTLIDVTVTGGVAPGSEYGGGLQNRGTTNLVNVTLDDNSAKYGGGAAARGGSLSLTNSLVTNNTATTQGGGLVARDGHLFVNDSIITLNSSSSNGGGISLFNTGTATVSGSTINNNTATIGGGGIHGDLGTPFLDGDTLQIINSEISDNTGTNQGGGIYVSTSTVESKLSIHNTQILRNLSGTGANAGGGISLQSAAAGEVLITGSEFAENGSTGAGASGAGLYNRGTGPLSIERTLFRDNNAGINRGGAIYSLGTSVNPTDVTIVDNTFDGNLTTSSGGAIYFHEGTLGIRGSTFVDNHARSGGAINMVNGILTMVNTTISGNRAENFSNSSGAGILFTGGSTTASIINSTITANHATGLGVNGVFSGGGGGLFAAVGEVHLLNTIVAGNTTDTTGPDLVGSFVSDGFNLIGDVAAAVGFGATGDQIGGNGNPVVNPHLGPLQDNGGNTFTHELFGTSPALDAGDSTVEILNDQRGNPRVQGIATDIGAVESVFDIFVSSFTSDGELMLNVMYEIIGNDSPAFDVGFYLSGDVQFDQFDTFLKTVTISDPAKLTIGQHTATFTLGSGPTEIPLPGAGTAEVEGSYYIVAVADPADAIFENVSDNNAAPFIGVYHPQGGELFVHGSPASDDISVTVGSIRIEINGQVYVYEESSVNSVVLRGHTGNDIVIQDAISTAVQIVGGRGDNELLWDGLGSVIDLTGYAPNQLQGAAVIDLTGGVSNLLKLDYASVSNAFGIVKMIRVLGDSSDAVFIGDGWTAVGVGTVFGVDFDIYRQDNAKLLISQGISIAGQDFGDAPASYLTSTAAHIAFGPMLGAIRDTESASNVSVDAFGDDGDGNDDEDGVASFATLLVSATTYNVDVSLVNTSGANAKLVGWIDFDGNGAFEPDEAATATVGNNDLTATLTWANIGSTGPDIIEGTTFARFRLSTDAITGNDASGTARDGEIEDYQITITMASTELDSADFDGDGDIDGRDFLAWQRGLGKPNAAKADGDADNDMDVDGDDLTVWQGQFGQPVPLVATLKTETPDASLAGLSVIPEALIDAAMALLWMGKQSDEEHDFIAESAPIEEVFAAEEITVVNTTTATSTVDAPWSTQETVASESADQPWLADELVERVFG